MIRAWLRLLAGLAAGCTVGAVLGLGIDFTSSATSVMGAAVALVVGALSTLALRALHPFRERPAPAGAAALLMLLCVYLAVGRMVWAQLGPLEVGAYGAAGLVMVWLVFTSVAGPPVFSALIFGGLAGALVGVLTPLLIRGPFSPLLAEVVGPRQLSLVFAALGLLGAFSGAFAAVGGRVSGWGLKRHDERLWTFDREGRVEDGGSGPG